jgi:hypothetical protein
MVESAGISFPGAKEVLGTSKDIFEIHNKAVAAGSMGQILLWVGFFEMVAGWPAMMQAPPPPGRGPRAAPQRATLGLAHSARSLSLCVQTLEGDRMPGDFGFDPLGLVRAHNAQDRTWVCGVRCPTRRLGAEARARPGVVAGQG